MLAAPCLSHAPSVFSLPAVPLWGPQHTSPAGVRASCGLRGWQGPGTVTGSRARVVLHVLLTGHWVGRLLEGLPSMGSAGQVPDGGRPCPRYATDDGHQVGRGAGSGRDQTVSTRRIPAVAGALSAAGRWPVGPVLSLQPSGRRQRSPPCAPRSVGSCSSSLTWPCPCAVSAGPPGPGVAVRGSNPLPPSLSPDA